MGELTSPDIVKRLTGTALDTPAGTFPTPNYPGYAPPGPCSCSIPEDGTWIHLTVENTVCPKVEGRKVKFALTPMQLSDLKHKIEAALRGAGW